MRFLILLAVCLLTFAPPSHAAPPACNAAAEGTLVYNKDYKIVQFCNGTQWIGMVARIGDTGDTLADLSSSCTSGEVAKWNGTVWACAADATGSAGLPGLAPSKIWVGDAGGTATAVTMSGDATLSNAGVLTIANNAVGSAEISDASIALADLSATGTKSSSTYLRGDNTWAAAPAATAAGSTGYVQFNSSNALAADTNLFWDNTTKRLGIGTTSPGYLLDVDGNARISGTVNPRLYLSSTDTAVSPRVIDVSGNAMRFYREGGAEGTSVLMQISAAGMVSASGFSGSGASLTNLNASNLASGTVPTARLGTGTANSSVFLRGDGTWAAPPSGADNLGNHIATQSIVSDTNNTDDLGSSAIKWKDGYFAGTVNAGTFAGSGASLTALPAASLTGTLPAISGANLTNLNASNLASGSVPAARMPALTGDITMTAGTTATNIASGVVGSAEIADASIATADLANSAVTYAKIQNVSANNKLLGRATTGAGAVEEITVGTGLSLSGTTLSASGTLPALASAKLWVGNGSNAATAVSISGDATVSNAGVLTLGSGVVGSAEIADGGVALADLAANSVNASKIVDASITAADTAFVGTLTEGKWCTVSSGKIVCTSDAPSGGGGVAGGQLFTASGTFTVPAGVTKIKVTLIGGGGKGSNASGSGLGAQGGLGGGGGATVVSWLTVTPGNGIAVSVGAGENTTFGSLTAAKGGDDGAGGVASGGAINIDGQAGGTPAENLADTSFGLGGEAAHPWTSVTWGNGGSGGVANGDTTTRKGKDGSSGVVLIEW